MPRGTTHAFSKRMSAGLLLLACVLCLAPFADKAFHIDDPLFVWAARHIQSHPLDFYGFTVNWDGFEKPMSEVTKNPPLASYYLALAASLFGWTERALHLAFLLPAAAAVLGTWVLAMDLCDRPFVAALACLATPVFLVSSTSVMCDTLMLALWVWAIYFWRRGLRGGGPTHLALASLLVAACGLTKYFGVSLIPLLAVFSIVDKRDVRRWLPFLIVPTLFLCAYQWGTHAMYGRNLLLDAGSYARDVRFWNGGNALTKALTGTVFAGGCFITAVLSAPWAWRKGFLAIVAILACGVTLALQQLAPGIPFRFPVTPRPGLDWPFLLQVCLFLFSGACVIALAVTDLWRARDADSLLLFLWMMGTIVFAGALNWSVNGRSILPAAPAFAILLVRQMGRRKPAGRDRVLGLDGLPVAAALLISLAVARADYRAANTARQAALEIQDAFKSAPGSLWFQGHWGFQYYLERAGGKSTDFATSNVQPGDIVVIPSSNTNTKPFRPEWVSFVREFRYRPDRLLATMDRESGAGFYSDGYGALPFAIASGAEDKYAAVRLIRPLR